VYKEINTFHPQIIDICYFMIFITHAILMIYHMINFAHFYHHYGREVREIEIFKLIFIQQNQYYTSYSIFFIIYNLTVMIYPLFLLKIIAKYNQNSVLYYLHIVFSINGAINLVVIGGIIAFYIIYQFISFTFFIHNNTVHPVIVLGIEDNVDIFSDPEAFILRIRGNHERTVHFETCVMDHSTHNNDGFDNDNTVHTV
jgi:hypothetical protein